MSSTARRRIYLAGPEVFLPQAASIGAEKCRLAAAAGFEGVFPHDASIERAGVGKGELAQRIWSANIALMRSCDAMIANLTPFRGVSADAGTVFEVGFMHALGLPVCGYTCARPDLHARTVEYRARSPLRYDADRALCEIEDYGLADNLMIEMAVSAAGCGIVRGDSTREADLTDLSGFRQCLPVIARALSS